MGAKTYLLFLYTTVSLLQISVTTLIDFVFLPYFKLEQYRYVKIHQHFDSVNLLCRLSQESIMGKVSLSVDLLVQFHWQDLGEDCGLSKEVIGRWLLDSLIVQMLHCTSMKK